MNLTELGNRKLKPLRSLVAFKWQPPKLKSEILIPDIYYNLGLQLGKFFIGEVLAVGPEVSQLKKGDKFIVHEYGIKDFRGKWKEDEIYFIEEENCNAKITNFKGLIERPLSKKEIEFIEKL